MRKIKNPQATHSNVSVRLMSELLTDAINAARAGDIAHACTCVRLAARFEDDVPAELSLGLKEAA